MADSATNTAITTKETSDIHANPLATGQREILDIVDQARALHIHTDVDMPELGVFGDQSSGKSSVLEAITRIRFLVKDSLSTRFAIEFALRHDPENASWSATIIPDSARNEVDQQRLAAFVPPDVEVHELGVITEAAAVAMGLGNERNFSHDVLRVTIYGPGLPNLTLIDLPGIFHGRGHGQTEEDAEDVRQLVQSYMKKPRTIILAVIAADQEISNQIVTRWAQEVDPRGLRTMGIITKPDRLDEHPTRAQQYVDVAGNKIIHFGLGWHLLKNRKHSESGLSPAERDMVEEAFFKTGIWATLPQAQKGIAQLLKRLSRLLKDHILAEAGPMNSALEGVLRDLEAQIEQLSPQASSSNLKAELLRVSEPFARVVEAATSGSYTHPVLRKYIQQGLRHVELRRLVEDLIAQYNQDMNGAGHAYHITEDGARSTDDAQARQTRPQPVARASFMCMIAQRVETSPYPAGQFDPELASDLFYELSKPWAILTNSLIDDVIKAVGRFLSEITKSLGTSALAEAVWNEVVSPGLLAMASQLRTAAGREMQVYTDSHATVRFSKQITDQIPQVRRDEMRRILSEKMPALLENGGLLQQTFARQPHMVSVTSLTEDVVEFLTRDVESTRFASVEIMHCSQEYYRTSLPKMLSRFDMAKFDEWMLSKLPALLSTQAIESVSEDRLARINSSNAAVEVKKEELKNRKVKVQRLLNGLGRIMRTSRKRDLDAFEELDE